MIEKEVHVLSKRWLESQGYQYKGVCNEGKTFENRYDGQVEKVGGHVPVPTVTENEKVLIDNQGEKQENGKWIRVWIEDKGSNANLSTLLEGFIRVVYAVYHGGGDGLLSVPHDRMRIIEENMDFIKQVAEVTVGKGRIGILDAEKNRQFFI